MPMGLEVEVEPALRELEEIRERMDDSIPVALERMGEVFGDAISREAPRGAGAVGGGHMAESVETRFFGPREIEVQPMKRTQEGWPLVNAVVGNPRTPRYTSKRPPIGPLMVWAAAVLGDPGAAWGVRENIFQRGHATFPNPFVDRGFIRARPKAEREGTRIISEAISG